MLSIDFYISQKTIELENSRNLESMDLEDIIYWCFSSRINFKDESKSLLLLPEACLFQVVKGLYDAGAEIALTGRTQTAILDKYDGYDLFINRQDNLVSIREGFKGIGFQLLTDEFLSGVNHLIVSVADSVKNVFPRLTGNSEFLSLVESWRTIDESKTVP